MKRSLFILLFISLCSSIQCQTHVFLDVNGDTISKSYYLSKIRNRNLGLRIWSWLGAKRTQFHQLYTGRYYRGYFEYDLIKRELEKLGPIQVPDSSSIIIEYYYRDDLCSSEHKDNKWAADEIRRRKWFLKPIKNSLNDKEIYFVALFEKGIKLRNSPKSKDEYFFLDKNNFFRNNLFTTPTTCGSHAAIKPNGQTLIENGEQRADRFSSNLKDDKWPLFFQANTSKQDLSKKEN